jgi:hypothetical protein
VTPVTRARSSWDVALSVQSLSTTRDKSLLDILVSSLDDSFFSPKVGDEVLSVGATVGSSAEGAVAFSCACLVGANEGDCVLSVTFFCSPVVSLFVGLSEGACVASVWFCGTSFIEASSDGACVASVWFCETTFAEESSDGVCVGVSVFLEGGSVAADGANVVS